MSTGVCRRLRKTPCGSDYGAERWAYIFAGQHPIGRFIADFYCAEARLVIEIDGSVHRYSAEEDALRQEFLESRNLRVLRFSNAEVERNLDTVVSRITAAIPLSAIAERGTEGER